MKLIVSANSLAHLNELFKKQIDGVILSIDKLAVNDAFYINVNMLDEINFNGKEVFVSLNKLMHNSDLAYLRKVLKDLKDKDVKILFYDMAVYNIAKEYNMTSKLVIYQDHLNASVLSNKFYLDLGIKTSYITSDITKEELLEIKENSGMNICFLGYGYGPIFYSRRYLISNYLKYIKHKSGQEYKIISDMGTVYPIEEEAYGTAIYTEKPINLINHLDELETIDYIVLKSHKIADNEFNKMVDKFIKREHISDDYIGFYDTKTVYRVKQVKDE